MTEYSSQQANGGRQASRDTEQLLGLVVQLQAELDELRNQLAASNRLAQLGMLSAGLAHEMNNFLTPIRSYAQLALAQLGEREATLKALNAAVQGTEKAGRLAERVMGLAAQQSVFETRVCDVQEMVASAVTSMTPAIKERGVAVSVDVEQAEAGIDALSLEQIFINLIANACHAMSDSPADRKIQIVSRRSADRLLIDVRDTGPGVPFEMREKIFEPFVTRAPALRDAAKAIVPGSLGKGGGSGLGLSICRQLLAAVDGAITLETTDKRGSTFRIDLPIATQA